MLNKYFVPLLEVGDIRCMAAVLVHGQEGRNRGGRPEDAFAVPIPGYGYEIWYPGTERRREIFTGHNQTDGAAKSDQENKLFTQLKMDRQYLWEQVGSFSSPASGGAGLSPSDTASLVEELIAAGNRTVNWPVSIGAFGSCRRLLKAVRRH